MDPDRRSLFGRKSHSQSQEHLLQTDAASSSSAIASSLPLQHQRSSASLQPQQQLQPQQSLGSDSSTTAAILQMRADEDRRRLAELQQDVSESKEMPYAASQLQAMQLEQQQQQQQQAIDEHYQPSLPPPTRPIQAGVPSEVSSQHHLASDPDGADMSVDPSAESRAAQLAANQLAAEGVGADGLSWLQKSSMQQAPVTVYYSKDPVSNLQLRVLLRKQPDEASAGSNPRTWKQLNLAMKEKQKKEERAREAALKSPTAASGHTSADLLAAHARSGDDDGSGEAGGNPAALPVDAQGRTALSPNPETDYKPAIITSQLFSWQQKVCSPAEIMLASLKMKSAASYAEQVSHLLRERFPQDAPELAARNVIATAKDGMMLHSKRDHDRYVDPDERRKLVTTSKKRDLNPLAERIVLAPLVSRKGDSHLTREIGTTPFHILATVQLPRDANQVTLLNKDHSDVDVHPPLVQGSFQKPLAVLKVTEGDEYVTLEMRPPFSPPQRDPREFDDAEWYTFYTPAGEHYRYRIENYSGVIDEAEAAAAMANLPGAAGGSGSARGGPVGLAHSKAYIAIEERKLEQELARMAQHDMMVQMHRSGREFDTGPLKGYEHYHILGEIIKTSGFEEEELSVSYELDLRHNIHSIVDTDDAWTMIPPVQIEAVTQTSTAMFSPLIPTAGAKATRECFFAFPFEFQLRKQVTHLALPPVLYFTVNSTSAWGISKILGYGFFHLPLDAGEMEVELDVWKPLGTLREQRTEYFLGAAPALRDVKLCGVPGDKDVLNRYGWYTCPTGRVHIRFQTVQISHPQPMNSAARQTSLALDALRGQYIADAAAGLSSPKPSKAASNLNSSRSGESARSQLLQRSQPSTRR